MRVMVLVPSVPPTLDAKVPWHFFQELEPMTKLGARFCVLSGVQPAYEMAGVEFRQVARTSLRRSPVAAVRLARRSIASRENMPPARSPRALMMAMRRNQWGEVILEHAQRWKPDVIHSHWAFPAGTGGMLAAAELGVPLVMTLRGVEHLVAPEFNYGECLDPIFERTLATALQSAARITICCSDSARRLGELGVEDSSRVRQIYHAVSADRFSGTKNDADAMKARLGLSDRTIISCVAGMDHGRKGHSTLIRAFAQIAASDAQVALLLVGDGPVRPELERLARDLSVAGRVIFHGKAHPMDVQHIMRMSAMTVLPTHCEVFGNVVFESLLAGTPVISGAAGAAKDVLPRGPYGQLFEPGNVAELAHAMKNVLQDPQAHRAMALRGAEFVRNEMSLARRAESFVNLYRELLTTADAAAAPAKATIAVSTFAHQEAEYVR